MCFRKCLCKFNWLCPEVNEAQTRVAQFLLGPGGEEIFYDRINAATNSRNDNEEWQLLLDVIKNGWSKNTPKLSSIVTPYIALRDTQSHNDGIILKANRVLIPRYLRSEIKSQLHVSRLGAESTIRKTTGMPNQVRNLTQNCETLPNVRTEQC